MMRWKRRRNAMREPIHMILLHVNVLMHSKNMTVYCTLSIRIALLEANSWKDMRGKEAVENVAEQQQQKVKKTTSVS